MRTILSAVSVLAILVMFVTGCGGSARGSGDGAILDGPKVKFDKLVHDFGAVGVGTTHECEFPFKNVGNSVLNITGLETPCGCTVPELNKRTYETGESGVLKVVYHAQTQPGKESKNLYVLTNEKDNPRITLEIQATGVRRVGYKPERLRFSLEKGLPEVQEITLESLDGRPFSIKSFRSTGDCVTADFDPSVKAARFVLKAAVDTQKLKSNLDGHINIALTHPECPSVSVYFNVLPRFTVIPPTIIVLDAKPLQGIRKNLSVRSNYGEPFEIDGIVSDDGSVRLMNKKTIQDGWQLVIEIVPPDQEDKVGYHAGTFSIRLGDGMQLPVNYRVLRSLPDSRGR